ncbi:MAG: hypothetical protein MZV64_60305 [Ignavibacteriales bacterium]|nr:hypothetical protein [Ignavibacteriales bacterium]
MRIDPKIAELRTALERLDDRRAAVRLHRHHARTICLLQPAQCLQFGKRLPHPHETRASAGGINDHIRQCPIEGFRQFIPHDLLAFYTIRLLERGEVEPALCARLSPAMPAASLISPSIRITSAPAMRLSSTFARGVSLGMKMTA